MRSELWKSRVELDHEGNPKRFSQYNSSPSNVYKDLLKNRIFQILNLSWIRKFADIPEI